MYLIYRNPKLRSLAILVCILVSVAAAFGQESSENVSPLPKPKGPVGDYAEVIDPATEAALDKKLRDFFDRTGVPISVATVKTTGDRDIFNYTIAVARGWGIGTKADDNPGLLMLVAVDDRKYFTQVSRNLEDELPDGIVGRLQRRYLVPELQKGNYGKGMSDTIDAYIKAIEENMSGFEPPAPVGTTRDEPDSPSLFRIFCCLAVILFIVLLVWSNRSNRRKSKDDEDRWGGGGGGGGGIAGVLPWIILGGMTGGGSSSDSSWGGSDWGSSSGDSGWGGFGGGGDFGGGGAGGDW